MITWPFSKNIKQHLLNIENNFKKTYPLKKIKNQLKSIENQNLNQDQKNHSLVKKY